MRSSSSSSMTLTEQGFGFRAFMRRQAVRLVGFGLLALVALGVAALATWSVADPSYSHATGNEAQNAIGYPGAVFADLAIQFFGLASLVALVPALIWGLFMVGGTVIGRVWRRALAWFAAASLAAGIIGCYTPPPTWPLKTGLGGVIGDIVLNLPRLFIGAYPKGLTGAIVALLLLAPALVAFAYASGLIARGALPVEEEEPKPKSRRKVIEDDIAFEDELDDDDDRPGRLVAAMGMISHGWLTVRGFLHRRFAGVNGLSMGEPERRSGWRKAAARVDLEDDGAADYRAPRHAEPAFDDDAPAHAAPAFLREGARRHVEPSFGDEPAPVRREAPAARRQPEPQPVYAQPEYDGFDLEDDYTPPPLRGNAARGDSRFAPPRRVEPQMFEQDEPEIIEPRFTPREPVEIEPRHQANSGRRQAASGRLVEPQMASFHDDANFDFAADDDGYDMPDIDAPLQDFRTSDGATTRREESAPAVSRVKVQAPAQAQRPAAPAQRQAVAVPNKSGDFELPELTFLAAPKKEARDSSLSKDALEQNARMLESVLEDFGVKGEIIQVRPGPVVTLYELEPAPGIKSSRVIGLADDIARSMSAIACRVAVVPGRNAIGIELPNIKRETVFLREILAGQDFIQSKHKLALALGKSINGEPVSVDIAKFPHVLVAGTTGSGKSVAINTMILSLVYRMTPDQCRLIMIDPKMVELSVYDGIPHLLTPVVTEPKKAVVALKWTVREMEDRYRKMAKLGVRNQEGFNERVVEAKAKGETITRTVQTGFDRQTGEAIYETEELNLEPMPFIVVIIDEVADLMMVAGKDIEGAVQRLGQMARAAGIHVIMATQRPSVDVITGTIKANFPTRMSFAVTSKIDSRTILGEMGAEQLLGQGDMLFMGGGGRIQRVHGPFVSDNEVEAVVRHLKTQGVPQYLDAITVDDEEEDDDAPAGKGGGGGNFEDSDDPYDQAVAIVLRDGKASTSYIQRRLGVGYNKAASIIEKMEKEGIVGPANHAGKREILVPTDEDKM